MRRAAEAWRISGDGLIPVLAVTAACFLLGGLVGCLLASHIGGGGQESLAAYVEGFLRAAQAGEITAPALASLVWDTVRWPLLALAAGLHRAGASRAATSVCGTGISAGLFDCLICAPVRRRGLSAGPFGLWGERCAFGAGAVCAWGAGPPGRPGAGRTGLGDGKTPPPYGKLYFFRCGACAVALCVSLLLDCFVVPGLVSSLAGTFLSL
ncbi:MAG: hypothetical protein ACLRNQ_27110 [Flavonifractor plautii]